MITNRTHYPMQLGTFTILFGRGPFYSSSQRIRPWPKCTFISSLTSKNLSGNVVNVCSERLTLSCNRIFTNGSTSKTRNLSRSITTKCSESVSDSALGNFGSDHLKLPWEERKFSGVFVDLGVIDTKLFGGQDWIDNFLSILTSSQLKSFIQKSIPSRTCKVVVWLYQCITKQSVQRIDTLEEWRCLGKKGVWIKIPLKRSELISPLSDIGFKCHHAKEDYIMMTYWLCDDEPNKLPKYSFHQVGVSGLALNRKTMEALAVQDKGKTTMWKFPGGFSEPGEDIGDTAIREIREETGIETEFESLLTFRHQHGMAYNQSDLYFICLMNPLTFEIKKCDHEIAKCEWIPIVDLVKAEESTPLTKLVSNLIIRGAQYGFEDVGIYAEEMQSWVHPGSFKIFHRPLNGR